MEAECTKPGWRKIWSRVAGIVIVLLFGLVPVTDATIPPEVEKNVSVTAKQDDAILPSLVSKDGFVFKGRLGESSKEYVFLLDTGAEMSVLDSKLIEELALPQLLEVDGRDASGNTDKVRIYKTKYLSVGKLAVHNLPILGLDMKFLQTTYGVPIDGILGYNFLKYFAVTLDYQHNQVALSLKSQLPPEQGALMANVNKNDFKVTIPATIDGTSVSPYIDTGGMIEYINLPTALLEKCKVKRYSKGGIISGAMGYSAQNILARAHVTIGNYDFKNALVVSSEMPILGQKFLSQFKVVLDYPRQKAWLIPNGKVELPKDEYGIGLGIDRDEQAILIVTGVWEGSPADLAHICVGDRITAINGIGTSDQTEAYWRGIMHDDTVSCLKLVLENSQGIREVALKKANLLSPYGKTYSSDEGFFVTAAGKGTL